MVLCDPIRSRTRHKSVFVDAWARARSLAKSIKAQKPIDALISDCNDLTLLHVLDLLESENPGIAKLLLGNPPQDRNASISIIKTIWNEFSRNRSVCQGGNEELVYLAGSFFVFCRSGTILVHYRLLPNEEQALAVAKYLLNNCLATLVSSRPIRVLRNHVIGYSGNAWELKIWGLTKTGYDKILQKETQNIVVKNVVRVNDKG